MLINKYYQYPLFIYYLIYHKYILFLHKIKFNNIFNTIIDYLNVDIQESL